MLKNLEQFFLSHLSFLISLFSILLAYLSFVVSVRTKDCILSLKVDKKLNTSEDLFIAEYTVFLNDCINIKELDINEKFKKSDLNDLGTHRRDETFTRKHFVEKDIPEFSRTATFTDAFLVESITKRKKYYVFTFVSNGRHEKIFCYISRFWFLIKIKRLKYKWSDSLRLNFNKYKYKFKEYINKKNFLERN